MAFAVHANLDCEAVWAGAALPPAVARRVSYYAALVGALAPPDVDDVEVWAPAAIDPARLRSIGRGWRAPAMRVGAPAAAGLRWAEPAAKAVNDRRLALTVAAAHGAALPGARVIERVEELALAGPWVCKAPWTSAGRDRCRGDGAPTPEQRARLVRLLARGGALVAEPWCERLLDVGVCATVQAGGRVVAQPPHGLLVDERGGFLGIALAAPALEPAERAQLAALVEAAGAALAERGYAGPFAVDAFAYRARDTGVRRFHPLCEINARHTFGWVARALAVRLGIARLGFGPPPPGAELLIAPGDDGVTAWCA